MSKVSGIILSKDEGYNLVDCINSLKPYLDEIIVIDSSKDNDSILTERICNDLGCKYEFKRIGDKGISGFADLRNYGNFISSNDWNLHVDVDEIFSDSFLRKIEDVVNESNRWAFKFPRINLPFYEKWYDYQVRLVNKKYTEWIGEVHERLRILKMPYEIDALNEYPIIHKAKEDKLEINKKWNLIKKQKRILVVSLFNNCEMWIDKFLENLEDMIQFTIVKCNFIIDILFIEGNSNDNTYNILNEWIEKKENSVKIEKEKGNKIEYKLEKININTGIKRFEKLAILRNMGIKLGLDDHDYVLMIDSDVIFDREFLLHLMNSIEHNKCDVIAPMVYIEKFREYESNYLYDVLAFVYKGKNLSHFYPYINENIKNINDVLQNGILEMDSVGTCYLAKGNIYNINDVKDFNVMKCYEESENKVFCLYDGKDKSEQVGFFENVKKCGYKVCLDMNLSILHINLEKYNVAWH